MNELKLLSLNEAAKELGISKELIAQQIKNGNLKVFILPFMKHPKIPAFELKNFIQQNTGVLYERR